MSHYRLVFWISTSLLTIVWSVEQSSAQTRYLSNRDINEAASTTRGAQSLAYRMRNSNDVIMYLTGTTPIKNWKLTAHGLQGEATILLNKDGKLSTIEALTFSLPVDNLKGEESAMEKEAHKALKSDKYHEIVFTLKTANLDCESDDGYVVLARGNLSVAGVVRDVTLRMRSKVQPDGSITFHGSQELRMSDYQVERPSLLFGMIKADDEMKLSYSLRFAR